MSLGGCALGMRTKAQVPYKAVAITGNPSAVFRQKLYVDILTYIDIKVAISPKDADLILEIMSETPNSQIDAYNSYGQITAYALNDVVTFRAYDIAGNEVMPETQIFAVRSMNFGASNVLSSDIQQAQFLDDIRKELSMQITVRIMSLGYRKRISTQ